MAVTGNRAAIDDSPVKTVALSTKMPVKAAESTPALLMPPPNVRVFSTAMAVWVTPPLATILLLPSTLMPPTMAPLSKMPPPLRKAPLTTEMPPAPIVPVLVTPPLNVVALITMAEVLPLKTVG